MALINLLSFIFLLTLFARKMECQNSCSLCRRPSECESFNNGSYLCHCKQGIKGKYCERLLEYGENLCLSAPCWLGGTCIGNTTSWKCFCPNGVSGINCKDNISMEDMRVKITNKGFFIAKLTLFYKKISKSFGELNKQTGSIPIGQDFTFNIPYDTDLSTSFLVAHAVAGVRIMSVRIVKSPSCFHVWGTTLFPSWSQMPC